MYNRIFKVAANKQKYYETINKFLFTVSSKEAILSDVEFERALQNANIYGNPALCRFLLLDIENSDGKEVLQADNLTIEHIMPQILSVDWSHIKPEEHEIYVHTLGNLSVTGYNSELYNKSFSEKKKIISDNSKAVILNIDVLDKESWTIADIQVRARRLSSIVMKRYKIDKVEDDTIEFDYIETITLDNYDEVIKFLREISNENNLSVSLRNISLSTCGLVDKIILLADSGLTVTLTISLHAADDETRLKIMPIAKKWKIKEVIDAAKYYFEKTGRRIIFEYSLIEGVNSSKKDAANLANIVSGLNCHINLIKLNYVKERGMSGADKDTVKAFMETLTAKKISNTLRRSMGNDIMGACGQLRNSYTKTEVAKN